ncbi:hypothetical protein D3C72_1802480 [compost metagenome]
MPIASRMLDTIRSMMTNGRYSRKPIWKAAVSSETRKEGISTSRSSCFRLRAACSPHSSRAVRTKKSRCSGRLFFIMNARMGSAPRATASMMPSSRSGAGAPGATAAGGARSSSPICITTGPMT